MTRPMTKSRFQEELLRIMDRKHHWAWPAFANGTVTVDQLERHFQQEYGVYVRDFPVFLHAFRAKIPRPRLAGCSPKYLRRRHRWALAGKVASGIVPDDDGRPWIIGT